MACTSTTRQSATTGMSGYQEPQRLAAINQQFVQPHMNNIFPEYVIFRTLLATSLVSQQCSPSPLSGLVWSQSSLLHLFSLSLLHLLRRACSHLSAKLVSIFLPSAFSHLPYAIGRSLSRRSCKPVLPSSIIATNLSHDFDWSDSVLHFKALLAVSGIRNHIITNHIMAAHHIIYAAKLAASLTSSPFKHGWKI